ncbi:hypothetical protein BVRB_1g016570 isoform B [Beta vulgaris subsp. vulgaris]|nr:hypothetical protein BVRB_1g016570 isoform B [Beta vulgaris subsp. vulgaris]
MDEEAFEAWILSSGVGDDTTIGEEKLHFEEQINAEEEEEDNEVWYFSDPESENEEETMNTSNEDRVMEHCISPECPTTVTIRRNPHRRARQTPSNAAINAPSSINLKVSNFPLNDILSIDLQQNQNKNENLPIPSPKPSNSLNVFLRVRPLPIPPSKSTLKKPTKRCLTVNDSHSVTISPPICDSNRLKSEVYNGFSHVFSSDSSQVEVYEKMMKPLVEEFLNGRSGLLAALGPSGSGKTHTVFGSAKEPGLLPRALRHIFDPDVGKPSSMVSRSVYISIFEIYSEKGKGEKLSDLSPDGSYIYMQQSVVKGLKEILVKDVVQAESVIAHAKSKRVTAMTNSNSQSSRSQCIINIRYAADETKGEMESLPCEAALTFVDLAGAEREKKTGNKGGKLLESNFINNTSMVFGLCLRSLLEYQKNPKKPLQKHFQSSLLTRYLRDYLEGRKRMALILNVRSGEEDYFDTSFLLRQASPYTEIKFCDLEETTNLPRKKRRHQIISIEHQKKARLSGTDGRDDVEMTSTDFKNIHKEEAKPIDILVGNQKNHVPQMDEDSLPKVDCPDSNIQRQYDVMQGFAKALWVVLKQYKERVKTMQTDIDVLTENLKRGTAQNLVLKKELLNLKSQCSCPKKALHVASCSMGGTISESRFSEDELIVNDKMISAISKVELLDCASELKSFLPDDESLDPTVILTQPSHKADMSSPDIKMSSPQTSKVKKSPNECETSHDMSKSDCHAKNQMEVIDKESIDATACLPRSHVMDLIDEGESCGCDTQNQMDKENVTNGPGSNFSSELESRETHSKPSKTKRPKRRLMPASSLLLRDAGGIDVTDENVKLRGGKGGRKLLEDDHIRSNGNASLLRLLKNHLSR